MMFGLFLALALFFMFLGAALLLGKPEQLGIPTITAFLLAAWTFYTVSFFEAVDYILMQPLEKLFAGQIILTFLEWAGLFYVASMLIFGFVIFLNGVSSWKKTGFPELFQ